MYRKGVGKYASLLPWFSPRVNIVYIFVRHDLLFLNFSVKFLSGFDSEYQIIKKGIYTAVSKIFVMTTKQAVLNTGGSFQGCK